VTVGEALAHGTHVLAEAGIDSARLESELLLARACDDCARALLYMELRRDLSPEAEDVDVELNDNDLKIDVYRSTGPGGQSVNTTDSAVRITHLPTGTVVAMQDAKSQLQNKTKALRELRAPLYELERERQAAEQAATRRSQIGSGERAEKIRTYNYPENRVTDHRVKLTVHNLDRVLEGELDEFTEALQAEERRQALETAAV
jgi:peptide chain release factor 1